MIEIIFLFILALIWIVFATIQDLRTREIANWLSFSLILFALGFRFFYSLFSDGGFGFFYQGLIGLGIFFVLGNLLYYGKMFAGGDSKLFVSMGTIIPVSEIFLTNAERFFLFFMIFLVVGGLYSMIASLWLCFKNYKGFKIEFGKQFRKQKNTFIIITLIAIFSTIAAFFINNLFFYLGILLFILPYLYIYAKAVDEAAMIRNAETKKLREGDWLYQDMKVGNKLIRADWNGLAKKEIVLLRKKYRKVLIREGVPFTPVFLVSFLVFSYLLIG